MVKLAKTGQNGSKQVITSPNGSNVTKKTSNWVKVQRGQNGSNGSKQVKMGQTY